MDDTQPLRFLCLRQWCWRRNRYRRENHAPLSPETICQRNLHPDVHCPLRNRWDDRILPALLELFLLSRPFSLPIHSVIVPLRYRSLPFLVLYPPAPIPSVLRQDRQFSLCESTSTCLPYANLSANSSLLCSRWARQGWGGDSELRQIP